MCIRDRSRSGQNVTFCNEDLKKVYHELFDEALAAYNAKKKKTRDKTVSYTHLDVYKRQGIRYQTTMSISGRASRRSYFTRLSFRSAT